MVVVDRLEDALSEFRLLVDRREGVTPGFKFNDWEMRGVPVRMEVGPKDVAKGTVTLARRDQPGRQGKQAVPEEGISGAVRDLLEDIQASLYARALAFQGENTPQPEDFEAFIEAVQTRWAEAWWCGDPECEAGIKEATGATTRCIPLDQPPGKGRCVHCGRGATERAVFGRAY